MLHRRLGRRRLRDLGALLQLLGQVQRLGLHGLHLRRQHPVRRLVRVRAHRLALLLLPERRQDAGAIRGVQLLAETRRPAPVLLRVVHSVVAKLHSELVDFMIKRPTVLIESVKAQSSKKCQLTDKDAAGKNQISTFAKYFLKAPGYNPSDLQRAHMDLPENCQEYLASLGEVDPEEMASSIEATEEAVENPAALLQKKSKHLHNALSQDEVGSSFLQGDAEVDTEFIIIFLLIIFVVLLIMFALAAAAEMGDALADGDGFGFFASAIFGGLVMAGLFMMAWPLGLAVLLVSLVVGLIAHDNRASGRVSGYMQKEVRDHRRLLDLAAAAM